MKVGFTAVMQHQGQASAYLWQVPGKPVAVQLDFDVVDRLLQEVLQGFGLMPRKSVEVGGLLLGSAQQAEDGRWMVTVTDFEPVPCRHTRGMGWLLSDEEQARFGELLARWRPGESKQTYAVGMFRSHGREGMGLTEEDLAMYERCFPEPWAVSLLVKPFTTRVSTGALFIREDGRVRSEASYLEFPFRRKELGGAVEEPLESEAGPEPEMHPRTSRGFGRTTMTGQGTIRMGSQGFAVTDAAAPAAAPPKKVRSGWVWIPLSFIFLLLGVVLGFQVALSVKSQLPGPASQDPYSLHLEVAPSGETSLHVRWDRTSPAIQAATGGVLHITDGGNGKQVKLDAAQLHNGSVVYRKATEDVTFRLEVLARERLTISETVEYRRR